jgi:hypothetical protein
MIPVRGDSIDKGNREQSHLPTNWALQACQRYSYSLFLHHDQTDKK